MYTYIQYNIWRFPEIGVPPNHLLKNRMFHYKPSSYCGTPITFLKPHICNVALSRRQNSCAIPATSRGYPPFWGQINKLEPEALGLSGAETAKVSEKWQHKSRECINVYIYISMYIYVYADRIWNSIYVYIIPSSASEVPPLPPEWDGSPGSTPTSLLFASYWQHF